MEYIIIASISHYLLSFSLKELGFPGIQIGSHINEWNLDAPEIQCIFQVYIINID